jgi:RNA polymerase sigma factor (sigma-70 family)
MEKLNDIKHGVYTLEQLIKKFKPYFRTMASNFTINSTTKEDLVCEAELSLWQSNLNHDPSRGATFFTYVVQQARFSMLNYLNQRSTSYQTVFVPSAQKEKHNVSTISFDSSINDFKTISETFADEVEEDIQDEKIMAVTASIKKLKKEHQDILVVKYLDECSDTDIAIMTGVTKQRVGQLVDNSIKKIQKDLGVPEVGNQYRKHSSLSKKEKELREKHKKN